MNENSSVFFQYPTKSYSNFSYSFEYLGNREIHDCNFFKSKYPQYTFFDMEKFR